MFLNTQVVFLSFFSHIPPPLPHLSTRSLTSYPHLVHPGVLPTSPISQRFSHPFSPIVSSLFFSFPLSVHLSHLMPLFIPPFSPLPGRRELRDCTQRHSVHHLMLTLHDPSRLFPPTQCNDARTRLFMRISSALH